MRYQPFDSGIGFRSARHTAMLLIVTVSTWACSEATVPAPVRQIPRHVDGAASTLLLVHTPEGTEIRADNVVSANLLTQLDWLRGNEGIGIPAGPSRSMSVSALSPVAWVAAGQTRLFRRNPDRLDILCGVPGPAPMGFGGFTLYYQNTISDPVAQRSETCSMSNGSSSFIGRAGSAGGARAQLGSNNWVDADGIRLEDFASITRQDGTAYQDLLTFNQSSHPSKVVMRVWLDGSIWNQFTPSSPAFVQAGISAASLALVLPGRGDGFAGKLNVNWLNLDSIPGTHFEGIFNPAPLYTPGYDTVTASISGTVVFEIPVTGPGSIPFTVNLYTAEFYYSLVPDPIYAYGTIHADFYNTMYLQSVTVFDAAGNDITADAAPTLASGLPLKQSQTITFTPALPASAVLGSSLTISATGGGSGNAVTFSTLTPSTCSVTGATVRLLSVGNCSVAADQAGNSEYDSAPQATTTVAVIWPFNGFFPPLHSIPAVNFAKAGSAVPIKFSLGGDRGLDILAAGSPSSAPSDCSANDATDALQISAPGASGFSYDPNTSLYTYVWKTAKAWAGTCRILTITLTDGTVHQAFFNFGL